MSLVKRNIVNSARTVKIERNMKLTLGTNKMATEFEGRDILITYLFYFLFWVFVVLMYIHDKNLSEPQLFEQRGGHR